jgi:putative nucleotide binding protein
MMQEIKKDEYVRILDFLPKGKMEVAPHRRKPIAQAIGEKYFSLLEIIPRRDAMFEPGERVYIGEGIREKVDHIERRIKYDWLTPTGKSELVPVIEDIVRDNEKKFVEFYNKAGVITTRQHKLEILPRIGKRHRQDILEEREKKPFQSFEDMRKRVKNLPDPVKVITERIIEELKGNEKYYLFIPFREREERGGRGFFR